MSLEYLYPDDGTKACSKEPLKVKTDGVICGEIRKVKDGFKFFPKGQDKGGCVFSKVSEVQRSLTLGQAPRNDPAKDVPPKNDPLEKKVKELAAMLKEAEGNIAGTTLALERAEVLLKACSDLLALQVESKATLNLLECSIKYDDTETDGHTLVGDLSEFLE